MFDTPLNRGLVSLYELLNYRSNDGRKVAPGDYKSRYSTKSPPQRQELTLKSRPTRPPGGNAREIATSFSCGTSGPRMRTVVGGHHPVAASGEQLPCVSSAKPGLDILQRAG